MTSYVVAAALTALLFATFVAFAAARRGCGDAACGTHERCAGCPSAHEPGAIPLDTLDSTERSE